MTDIDLLKSSIDIRGHAQRIGLVFDKKNKHALCPNHEDTNPSLQFKEDYCHCFVCQFHEDVIGLHCKVKGLKTGEALDDLAKMYNLNGYAKKPTKSRARKRKETTSKATKPSEGGSEDASAGEPPKAKSTEYSDVYEALERFCGPPDGSAAEYLTGRRRGLLWETIERFRIFTVKDYRKTAEHLATKFAADRLKASGICNERGNLVFFKHTIVIPFVDQQDMITTLRGRYFFDSSPDPTGEIKGKMLGLAGQTSKILYNVRTLKDHEGTVYLCEGEFDAMICEQYGYRAVGLLGVGGWDKNWMPKLLKSYRLQICIDNPKPGGYEKEKTDLEDSIDKITDSLLDEGNKSIFRPQIPLDFKDVTDYLVETKGEFQE